MFETKFQHASSSPLPSSIDLERALAVLHDFPVVIRLNPDCRGCKPIPAPQAKQAKKEQIKANAKANGETPSGVATPPLMNGDGGGGPKAAGEIVYYEVEDDLPFMPKKLWSGGVKYIADFLPTVDGCDITVHAPGGFTSTNHWRLVRQTISEESVSTEVPVSEVLDAAAGSKDLSHAETTGGGWYVQIVSDAQCNRTFAGIVKGFLKNSHQQLQTAFIERMQAPPVQQRSRRPTLGRRRSSVF